MTFQKADQGEHYPERDFPTLAKIFPHLPLPPLTFPSHLFCPYLAFKSDICFHIIRLLFYKISQQLTCVQVREKGPYREGLIIQNKNFQVMTRTIG